MRFISFLSTGPGMRHITRWVDADVVTYSCHKGIYNDGIVIPPTRSKHFNIAANIFDKYSNIMYLRLPSFYVRIYKVKVYCLNLFFDRVEL